MSIFVNLRHFPTTTTTTPQPKGSFIWTNTLDLAIVAKNLQLSIIIYAVVPTTTFVGFTLYYEIMICVGRSMGVDYCSQAKWEAVFAH